MHERRAHHDRPHAGFSLVELLVVVTIIVLVIGIVVVSGANVVAASRHAATERLLASVSTAIEMFHADHDFYPPLLTHHPTDTQALCVPDVQPNAFDNSNNDPLVRARFHSVYSLAAYLVGVGDLRGDDINVYAPDPNLDDGHDGPGIRNPGPDQAWGGALGGLTDTNAQYQPPPTGRVFGPYVDVKPGRTMRQVENRGLARVDVVQENVTESDVSSARRYTIVDRWGNAVRYYRHWPIRDTGSGGTGDYTLDDVPLELLSFEGAQFLQDGTGDGFPPQGDGLFSAPYALLSAGEDGYYGEAHLERTTMSQRITVGTFGLGEGVFSDDETGQRDQRRIIRRIENNIRVLP